MRKSNLTLERLKEALDYNPETGLFTRKIRIGNAAVGKVVCVIANDAKCPYIYVCLDKERHYAHRLAWFYMTGEWPPHDIDHKNRIHNDNRWENLRSATTTQNLWNIPVRKSNKSGLKGVSRTEGRKRWFSRFNKKYIGSFDTAEEAHDAYAKVAKAACGEFFRSE